MTTERRSDVVYSKNLIIKSIIRNEPHGRRVFEIVNDTGLHRTTVSDHCKELQYDDFVITRKNKQAAYHLTQKMYGDPDAFSFLFQREVIDKIRDNDMWIADNSIFCNTNYCNSLTNTMNDSKCANKDHETYQEFEKLTLFEFANRIGAWILYSILQSIQPKNKKKNEKDVLRLKKETISLKGKGNNQATSVWLQLIDINKIFREFFQLSMIKERLIPCRQQDNTLQPLYQMNEDSLDNLENIFSCIYPQFYKKLQRIRKDTDNTLNYIYNKKRAYLQSIKQDPDHTKCNGTLLPEIKIDMDGNKVQQCTKCNRWITIGKS